MIPTPHPDHCICLLHLHSNLQPMSHHKSRPMMHPTTSSNWEYHHTPNLPWQVFLLPLSLVLTPIVVMTRKTIAPVYYYPCCQEWASHLLVSPNKKTQRTTSALCYNTPVEINYLPCQRQQRRRRNSPDPSPRPPSRRMNHYDPRALFVFRTLCSSKSDCNHKEGFYLPHVCVCNWLDWWDNLMLPDLAAVRGS